MNNKYLVYCRKSTDDTENQQNSLEYQEQLCLKYAKEKNLEVGDVVRESHSAYKTKGLKFDKGIVLYSIERPLFMKTVTRVCNGEFKGIISLSWDRISRNKQDNLLVDELIKENKIDIKFVKTEYAKGAAGFAQKGIEQMFAEYHSVVTSEKIVDTFEKLLKEGKWPHKSPIGYLDNGVDNKPLDPIRAPKVKQLLELYASGEASMSILLKRAHDIKLTTKPSKNNKITKSIKKGTIEKILTNVFYIGKLEHKGRIYDGLHPPLIDIHTFEAIQKNLKDKCVTIKFQNNKFFTYRGKLRCTCGRVYTPERKKAGKFLLYSSRCKTGCKNSNKHLNEKNVDFIISKLMKKISFSNKELKEIEKEAKSGINIFAEKRNNDFEILVKKKKTLLADLDYLKENKVSLLRENAYSIMEYHQESKKLEVEIKEIDKQFSKQTETEFEMLKFITDFSELIKMASEYYKSGTDKERYELCSLMFSELIIFDGKLISYDAKPAFEKLLSRYNIIKKEPLNSDSSIGVHFGGA
ncbi:recombinase family protein [Candidatus Peregrinibacteria bacterium]|jgi:site-specific DNA recombinase|nr:recombinase family protein [Candidatus Peregrinibacteria bacterium]